MEFSKNGYKFYGKLLNIKYMRYRKNHQTSNLSLRVFDVFRPTSAFFDLITQFDCYNPQTVMTKSGLNYRAAPWVYATQVQNFLVCGQMVASKTLLDF